MAVNRSKHAREVFEPQPGSERQLQVLVRDNNVDQALRVLKKRMQREGIFREMKQRSFYEKPSERRGGKREKPSVACARSPARKRSEMDFFRDRSPAPLTRGLQAAP